MDNLLDVCTSLEHVTEERSLRLVIIFSVFRNPYFSRQIFNIDVEVLAIVDSRCSDVDAVKLRVRHNVYNINDNKATT